MDDHSPSFIKISLPWLATALLVVLVGLGLWMLRAQTESEKALLEPRAMPQATSRPPLEGETQVANQLGVYAGNGVAGPNLDFSIWGDLVLPSVEFQEATVTECLEVLRQESQRLHPQGRGVVFVLSATEGDLTDLVEKMRISVRLTNVPLSVAIKYVTDLSGLSFHTEGPTVTLHAAGTGCVLENRLVTREFKVPPDFLTRNRSLGKTGVEAGGFFGDGGSTAGDPPTAKSVLAAAGVSFDLPGSSATYLSSSSKVVVRHTQQYIDLIESMGGCQMTTTTPETVVQPIPDVPLFR